MKKNTDIKEQITLDILHVLNNVMSVKDKNTVELTQCTVIAGTGALIDSLALISLLVKLEEVLNNKNVLNKPLVENFLGWMEENESVSVHDLADFILGLSK